MLRILGIDDDPQIHQLLNSAFQKKGHFYSFGLTGAEGLSILEKESYDIVIVDLKLPDIDGVEVCGRIRRDPDNAGLILALVSAYIPDVETFRKFISDLNLDIILKKPFDPEKLLEMLSRFLIDEKKEEVETGMDEILLELRKEYLDDFPCKLQALKTTMDMVLLSPENSEMINGLMRQTHKIHGNAGIYGLHDLGDIAGEWEESVKQYIEMNSPEQRVERIEAFFGTSETFHAALEKRFNGYLDSEAHETKTLPVEYLGGNAASITDTSAFDMALRQVDRGGNKIILLVEDDPAVQRMISYTLKTRGYSYEIIGDGDEARKRIVDPGDVGLPGLLVLDINLPGTDGFTLLSEFHNAGILNNMNTLVLTSHGREDDMMKAFDAGAVDYVTKPFSIPVLMCRIQRALASRPAAGVGNG